MFRALTLVSLLFITGCKKDVAPEAAFWSWVRAHTAELKAVRTGQEPIVDELSKELKKASPGLAFELGVGTEPFEFIISADGILDRFEAVKQLTSKAGDIPGVKVIAFRPRKAIDGFEMRFGELTMAAADVKFVATREAGKVDLKLYVDGLNDENSAQLKKAGFVLLDAAIGEYDMETKVGVIEFHPGPAPEGAQPLSALASTL